MRVETFSYRYAEEILQHPKYVDAYNELIRVCEECPIPYYEGKSANQAQLNVVQQMMNTYFKLRFMSLGWQEEPLATPDDNDDALRSDFRKSFVDEETGEILVTIQIEVEFGNVASSYRNYFKFQLSYSYDLTDVCVLIVPSQHLSVRVDSGVSNFEKTTREIPSAKLSVTVPTLVMGLFDTDEEDNELEVWNVKEINQDLRVLKGNSRATYPLHCEIVQEYIDNI